MSIKLNSEETRGDPLASSRGSFLGSYPLREEVAGAHGAERRASSSPQGSLTCSPRTACFGAPLQGSCPPILGCPRAVHGCPRAVPRLSPPCPPAVPSCPQAVPRLSPAVLRLSPGCPWLSLAVPRLSPGCPPGRPQCLCWHDRACSPVQAAVSLSDSHDSVRGLNRSLQLGPGQVPWQ